MYIRLKDNVYLVKGKCKDCVYDLNHCKLYHFEKGGTQLIEEMHSNSRELDAEQRIFINKLLELDMLEMSDCQTDLKDIRELEHRYAFRFAWIEICNMCNLKCIHCYNESSPECNDIMSYADFIMVCEKLNDIGVERIQIIGGEPMLHPDIKEILRYASATFKSVEIFTNGTLITDDIINVMKEENIKVALSVYSYSDAEHDKVTTVQGSHNRTVAAIEKLNYHNISCRIATVHIKGISIGECNTKEYKINPDKDVIRLAGRGEKTLLTDDLLRKRLITKKTFQRKLDVNKVATMVNHHQCFSSKLYISAVLDVYPCVMERRLKHGNIRNNRIDEIIKENIIHLNKDKIDECKKCEFRYACYDCRPNTIGELESKPYFCTYNVNQGEWLDENEFIKDFFNDR